jgi:hypothetical protein
MRPDDKVLFDGVWKFEGRAGYLGTRSGSELYGHPTKSNLRGRTVSAENDQIRIWALLFMSRLGGKEIILMSMKLYVGNLSFNTGSAELEQLFSSIGTVESASVVEDRETGRSRGFGFVEMASKEDGERAIAELDGKDFEGRAIKVNEAKPREDRGGGGGYGGGNRGGGGGYGGGGNRGGGGGYGGGSRW